MHTLAIPPMTQTKRPSKQSMGNGKRIPQRRPVRPAISPESVDSGAVLPRQAPVDPVLDRLDKAARLNLENTKSPHTRRAYARHWRDFELWCQEMGIQEMPARATDIVRYLTHLELQGRSIATVRLARSALVHAFRLRGMPDHENPGRAGVVSETLKGMSTRFKPQRQAAALIPQALNAIRSTALIPKERSNGGQPETKERAMLRGRVDIAMCLLLRDAGLRRSEAAAVTWEDIEYWPDGSGRLSIRRSKTNRTGEPEVVAITPAGMAHLRISAQRGQRQDRRCSDSRKGRSPEESKRQPCAAGLGEGYSGHSGRVGLARYHDRKRGPQSM